MTVDRGGETVVLRPKQLVLATGMSGIPSVPEIQALVHLKGHNIIPVGTPVVKNTAARRVLWWVRVTRLTTSAPTYGSTAQTLR